MSDMFPIERSSLYLTHLAEEQELAKLKWIESEKAGYDIGIYRARWLWLTRHRAAWVSGQRHQNRGAQS